MFVIIIIVLLIIFFDFVLRILFTVKLWLIRLQLGLIVLSFFNKKGFSTSESFNGFSLMLCPLLICHHLVGMSIISSDNEGFSGIVIHRGTMFISILGHLLRLFIWRQALRI